MPGQPAMVIWLGADSLEGDSDILYARWAGASWGPPSTLHPANATSELSPRISVAGDGSLWTVWKAPNPAAPGSYLGLLARWDGSAWSNPDTLWRLGGRHDVPAVAAVNSSEAWIIRDGYPPGSSASDIFAYHMTGFHLDPEFQFVEPDSGEIIPNITVDQDGRPWAVWYRENNLQPRHARLWYSRYDGGAWSEPEPIPAPLAPLAPKIICDRGGQMWIVTLAPDPSDPGVGAGDQDAVWVTRWNATSWEPPWRIDSPLIQPDSTQDQLTVTRMPGGETRAVWIRGSIFDIQHRTLITSSLAGGAWSTPEPVGLVDDYPFAMWPDIADDGVITWAALMRRAPAVSNVFTLQTVATPTSADDFAMSAYGVGAGIHLQWSSGGLSGISFVQILRDGPLSRPPDRYPPLDATAVEELMPPFSHEGAFLDRSIQVPGAYAYWLRVHDRSGVSQIVGPAQAAYETAARGVVHLTGIMPNPGRGGVALSGVCDKPDGARVRLFDSHGRLVHVIPCRVEPGASVSAVWDGRTRTGAKAAAGAYFAVLQQVDGIVSQAEKLILIR